MTLYYIDLYACIVVFGLMCLLWLGALSLPFALVGVHGFSTNAFYMSWMPNIHCHGTLCVFVADRKKTGLALFFLGVYASERARARASMFSRIGRFSSSRDSLRSRFLVPVVFCVCVFVCIQYTSYDLALFGSNWCVCVCVCMALMLLLLLSHLVLLA